MVCICTTPGDPPPAATKSLKGMRPRPGNTAREMALPQFWPLALTGDSFCLMGVGLASREPCPSLPVWLDTWPSTAPLSVSQTRWGQQAEPCTMSLGCSRQLKGCEFLAPRV